MLWLQTPQVWRWLVATALVLIAVWTELAPTTTVEHPFATTGIARGDSISSVNTEMREVPKGLFDEVEAGSIAALPVMKGEPVLESSVALSQQLVPPGLWIVAADVPHGAQTGDEVRLVDLTTSETHLGIVVSSGSTDSFSEEIGSVAVEEHVAAQLAIASAEGSLAVLVSSS